MPLNNYGVLKGYVLDRRVGAGNGKYHILVGADTVNFHVMVNTKSTTDSILRYYISHDFSHPITDRLLGLVPGFRALTSRPGDIALDYTRENLINETDMESIPAGLLGAHTKMNEVLDNIMLCAMSEASSNIFVFGERWGPESHMDINFGFLPGNGIHDVHMNQGSVDQFTVDNGVYQDGGLLIYRRNVERWQALLFAFESQSWTTNDGTGHTIPTSSLPTSTSKVQISAALINPKGGGIGKENVTLANRTGLLLDISGWSLLDTYKRRSMIDDIVLKPYSTAKVKLSGSGVQLSNKGGLITLVDQNGSKVDGVSYTRDQSSVAGVELIWPARVEASVNQVLPEEVLEQVFLSYSRENSQFVLGLAQELKERGFRVWIDQMSIPAGADWDRSIDIGIRQSNLFVVVLSKNSVESMQVGSEIQLALDEHKPIFPVIYDDCEVPRILRRMQHVNFNSYSENAEKPLQELISSMRQHDVG